MRERQNQRSRSRSPGSQRKHHKSHRQRSPRTHANNYNAARTLPFAARELTKHDLSSHRALFALFLDIQKQLDIEELEDHEVKGRWKSFIKKWNRGELAEGWYDSKTLAKAQASLDEQTQEGSPTRQPDSRTWEDDDEDADFGPALPQDLQGIRPVADSKPTRSGPTIPTFEDIRSRNEEARASAEEAREQGISTLRQERKLDRHIQKERLDELVPRAEAGTRERQLEKRKDLAASQRAFAATKDAGGDVELPDSDVMGGDDLSELKRVKAEHERRKTDRQVKHEEMLRARAAVREERTEALREKEEKTMSMLRALAKERFGGGNDQPATLRDE